MHLLFEKSVVWAFCFVSSANYENALKLQVVLRLRYDPMEEGIVEGGGSSPLFANLRQVTGAFSPAHSKNQPQTAQDRHFRLSSIYVKPSDM